MRAHGKSATRRGGGVGRTEAPEISPTRWNSGSSRWGVHGCALTHTIRLLSPVLSLSLPPALDILRVSLYACSFVCVCTYMCACVCVCVCLFIPAFWEIPRYSSNGLSRTRLAALCQSRCIPIRAMHPVGSRIPRRVTYTVVHVARTLFYFLIFFFLHFFFSLPAFPFVR